MILLVGNTSVGLLLCHFLIVLTILNQNETKYNFIIQISNILIKQCNSLCLYGIEHITKAIICPKLPCISGR